MLQVAVCCAKCQAGFRNLPADTRHSLLSIRDMRNITKRRTRGAEYSRTKRVNSQVINRLINKHGVERCVTRDGSRRAPISSSSLFAAGFMTGTSPRCFIARACEGEDKEYCIYFTELWLFAAAGSPFPFPPSVPLLPVRPHSALQNDNYYNVMIAIRETQSSLNLSL